MTQDTQRLASAAAANGFRLISLDGIAASDIAARLLCHEKTGAELLHLSCPDVENCLAVSFPTEPEDDSGVAHVLEHCVLCGSRKYPGPSPFHALKESSCATFINAVTTSTFTCYPIVTSVKRDFRNLADVYLDAIFYPTLTEGAFRREGHHLKPADPSEPPGESSGVVYNEMRAKYSSPEGVIRRSLRALLFEGSPLAFDAGGHPDSIAHLSHTRLRAFFDERYHPSNARIFSYGDIPTEEHVERLGPLLDDFERRPARPLLGRVAAWDLPRHHQGKFPHSGAPGPAAKVVLSWVVGDVLDADLYTDWKVLQRVLFGHAGAALSHSLTRAKIGSAEFMCGLEAIGRELVVHVGTTGCRADALNGFTELVMTTLRSTAQQLDPARVQAAFHHLSYDSREVKPLPGYRLLEAVNAAWLHGGPPLLLADGARLLQAARDRYSADPSQLSRRILDLLDNPHRLSSVWEPSAGTDAAKVAAKVAQTSPVSTAFAHGSMERARQSPGRAQPSRNGPPPASGTIPSLSPSELPHQPWEFSTEVGSVGTVDLIRSQFATRGVNYLALNIDLSGLQEELFEWLPRYGELINQMGLRGQGFEILAQRKAACMGSFVGAPMSVRHAVDPDGTLAYFRIFLKTVDERAPDAFGLLEEILHTADLQDRARFAQVLLRAAHGHRMALINDPMLCVQLHALIGTSLEARLQEQWFGPRMLERLERQAFDFDAHFAHLLSQTEKIRDHVLHAARWSISFSGGDRTFDLLQRRMRSWGNTRGAAAGTLRSRPGPARRQGLSAPLRVAQCARALPGLHLGHADFALVHAGLHICQYAYLTPALRTEGSAYGAGIHLNSRHAAVLLTSHADPDPERSLRVFEALPAWVASNVFTASDVDRAVVACAKEAVRPVRPGEATSLALDRWIRGDTRDMRRERHERLRGATPTDVKESLERLFARGGPTTLAVAASPDVLEQLTRSSRAEWELRELLPSAPLIATRDVAVSAAQSPPLQS